MESDYFAKVTKYPKLQNLQSYKMSKDKKAQTYKISKVTKCPKIQNVQRY